MDGPAELRSWRPNWRHLQKMLIFMILDDFWKFLTWRWRHVIRKRTSGGILHVLHVGVSIQEEPWREKFENIRKNGFFDFFVSFRIFFLLGRPEHDPNWSKPYQIDPRGFDFAGGFRIPSYAAGPPPQKTSSVDYRYTEIPKNRHFVRFSSTVRADCRSGSFRKPSKCVKKPFFEGVFNWFFSHEESEVKIMAKSKNLYLQNWRKTLQITFDIWPKSV